MTLMRESQRASEAGEVSGPEKKTWVHLPATVLHRLTEPGSGQPEPERRRAHMLAWLLLTLIFLVSVTLLLVFIVDSSQIDRRGLYALLITGLLLFLIIAFSLNHSGHYKAAALLTVTCTFVGPWGAIALDRTILQGDFVPLVYVALSVIVSSILLSPRVTVIISILQFAALLLIPQLTQATALINWPSLLAFIFFTSMLGIVSNVLIQQDLDQIDQQTRRLQESEAALRELSVRDPLTGLFNRRYLEETLERELRRAERKNLPLGVIMMDVDFFKRFNDTYGHVAGDEILRLLGASLRQHIRGSDIVCRYGGEEFIFILPETSFETTFARANLLVSEARRLSPSHAGVALGTVTLSAGVAVFPEHGSNGGEVLAAADAALYQAKIQGRDRVAAAHF
jgi:diguanylate cyclase (GGDEF)-like protein